MEYIFQADHSAMWVNIGLSSAGLIGAAITFWWLSKRSSAKLPVTYRQLLQLLTAFIFVTCLGIVGFSALTIYKLSPVTLTGDKLSTPYGDCSLSEINLAEIRANESNGLVARKYSDILVIETVNKQAFVLTAEQYDIEAILSQINQKVKEGK
ncbi:MAG: hypothetical protein ABIV51_08305 [Saprospiraceae bacterium]